MKASAILIIVSLCYSVTLQSQASNWFVVVTPGYGIGGPGGSILSNVNKSGFNGYENNWLFGSIKNPQVFHYPSLLLTLGKRIRRNGSIYLMIGQTTRGYVNGYNGQSKVFIDYSVLQCAAGYQFSFPKTHFKIGVGPSLFLLRYSQHLDYSSDGNSTSIVRPGISVMTRIPLGGEKKIFGVELFFAFNLASSTTMKELPAPGGDLPSCNAGLVHAVAGISFAFRH